MKLSGEAQAQLVKYGVIALGVIGLAWYLKRRIGGATDGALTYIEDLADSVLAAVNPASDKNLAYRGASEVIRVLPGTSDDDTLGTWLYGLTHTDPFANDPTIRKRGDAAPVFKF